MWMTVWKTQLRLGLFAGILPAHMTSAATFPTQWPSLSSPKTTQGELHPRLCISTLKQQGKLSCLWECSYHLFCPMTTSPHQFDSPLTTDVRDEREGWEHFQALTSAKKKKKSKYTPSLQNLARDQQVWGRSCSSALHKEWCLRGFAAPLQHEAQDVSFLLPQSTAFSTPADWRSQIRECW